MGKWGAAATCFYVRPSQVSKKTESGESLGRGSFVVRGQRHWFRDLKLELGIGMGIVNGVPLPVIGTAESIADSFGRWARITPVLRKRRVLRTPSLKPRDWPRMTYYLLCLREVAQ